MKKKTLSTKWNCGIIPLAECKIQFAFLPLMKWPNGIQDPIREFSIECVANPYAPVRGNMRNFHCIAN